jgi:hypothetical protein
MRGMGERGFLMIGCSLDTSGGKDEDELVARDTGV